MLKAFNFSKFLFSKHSKLYNDETQPLMLCMLNFFLSVKEIGVCIIGSNSILSNDLSCNLYTKISNIQMLRVVDHVLISNHATPDQYSTISFNKTVLNDKLYR